jgi:hypothetical protein
MVYRLDVSGGYPSRAPRVLAGAGLGYVALASVVYVGTGLAQSMCEGEYSCRRRSRGERLQFAATSGLAGAAVGACLGTLLPVRERWRRVALPTAAP